MRVLFIFLDGVGLAPADPQSNPLAVAQMPFTRSLLSGLPLSVEAVGVNNGRASLLALDACLGVEGLPQSATGQATLLTGVNVPAQLGYHYGPKPNPQVSAILKNGNLFNAARKINKSVTLMNAYPERYFHSIRTGRRLYSAFPLAAVSAGIALKTEADLVSGQALSADFTAYGWHDQLGIKTVPLLTPAQAGGQMAAIAGQHDLSIFEYWLTDIAGHHQNLTEACTLLESFDQVLEGLVDAWDFSQGLILITSDHGNLEDLRSGRHTTNPAPCLTIRGESIRHEFNTQLQDIKDIAPAILRVLTV